MGTALLSTALVQAQGRGLDRRGCGNERGSFRFISRPNEVLRTSRAQSSVNLPSEGPNHQGFRANVLSSAPQSSFMAPMRNAEILTHVRGYAQSETVHNRYYWHNEGGYRFCHYYDEWGYHWYGWYLGDDFFWTRYYYGRWWWYDSDFDRWCYWHDDGWWWQDPSRGGVYVYENNTYTPVGQATSEAPPAASNHTEYWDAVDHRVVKLLGSDAFLYDTGKAPGFDPKFLASNVTDVKFSKAQKGHPLQIILTLEDGSFLPFDGKGNPRK